MTQPSLESLFGGGGGKSVSWKDKPIGTVAGGTIKTVQPPAQVTDLVTKEPKFKKNGQPVMHVRIDLATNERDPQDPEDDGSRSLYAQGWMFGAIGDAMRTAGVEGTPQPGAQLWVTLTDRTPPDTPGLNPTNKFSAVYIPGPAVATNQLFAQQPAYVAPAAQQPAYAVPVPPPQYAPAPGGYAAPPPTYVQQPPVPQQVIQQAPPVQQAPPAAPLPPKPDSLAQAAWDTMPDDVKRSVAATFAGLPPF
jgi:hypothetical protein